MGCLNAIVHLVYDLNKITEMNKLIMLMTLSLSVGLSACSSSKSRTDSDKEEVSVNVALPVVDSVVLHKEYPGTLSAHQEVDLVARVNGYLRYSGYDPGSLVKKGTVLFRIEDSQYRDAVIKQEPSCQQLRRLTYMLPINIMR